MKISNNSVGMLIFIALAATVFVLMVLRPAVDGNAMNLGVPMVGEMAAADTSTESVTENTENVTATTETTAVETTVTEMSVTDTPVTEESSSAATTETEAENSEEAPSEETSTESTTTN